MWCFLWQLWFIWTDKKQIKRTSTAPSCTKKRTSATYVGWKRKNKEAGANLAGGTTSWAGLEWLGDAFGSERLGEQTGRRWKKPNKMHVCNEQNYNLYLGMVAVAGTSTGFNSPDVSELSLWKKEANKNRETFFVKQCTDYKGCWNDQNNETYEIKMFVFTRCTNMKWSLFILYSRMIGASR